MVKSKVLGSLCWESMGESGGVGGGFGDASCLAFVSSSFSDVGVVGRADGEGITGRVGVYGRTSILSRR